MLARLLWGVVTLLMVALMVVDGSVTPIPGITALLTLVAALFTEEWYFDAARHEVRRVTGVLPLVRTLTYATDRLENVQVTSHQRGRSTFRRLVILPREGRPLVVDMGRGDGAELEDYARRIAAHLEIDLK